MAEDQKENQTENQTTVAPASDVGAPPQPPAANQGDVNIEAIYDVPVQVSAVLGRVTMSVGHLLKLGRGAVVELDRRVGESVDIYVNNRLVARGEIVVMEEHLGVTLTELIRSGPGKL